MTWLPDSSGVVLSHGGRGDAIAVLLDGSVRALPFHAEYVADFVNDANGG